MNVRIKTAHGYLSFQPDGTLQYRPGAGAWEEIDIEGLDLASLFTLPVQPWQPSPTPLPPVEGPPPSMTPAYVAAVKARCLAAGIMLSGAEGAFQITKRVAWGLREYGIGLVSKSSGNNWQGYSVDYLCWANGDGVDILGDAGGGNTPQWAAKPDEFSGQDRWRKPVQP